MTLITKLSLYNKKTVWGEILLNSCNQYENLGCVLAAQEPIPGSDNLVMGLLKWFGPYFKSTSG